METWKVHRAWIYTYDLEPHKSKLKEAHSSWNLKYFWFMFRPYKEMLKFLWILEPTKIVTSDGRTRKFSSLCKRCVGFRDEWRSRFVWSFNYRSFYFCKVYLLIERDFNLYFAPKTILLKISGEIYVDGLIGFHEPNAKGLNSHESKNTFKQAFAKEPL